MPFALVTIGLIMVISGARNTHAALGKQIKSDFTGPNNFLYWIVAVGVVGSIGYVESLRNVSRAFLALVIISMILANGRNGLFAKFTDALKTGPISPKAEPDAAANLKSGDQSSGLAGAAKTAATVLPLIL